MAGSRLKSARSNRRPRKPGAADGVRADAGDLRLLARDAALAALKRLADLSRSEDERVALAATQELLNRAFGKVSAGSAEEAPASQPLIIRIVKFGEIDSADSRRGAQ
ncbi:MAG: hypothetical protein R3D05_04685 [Dongiaceae bacterium]